MANFSADVLGTALGMFIGFPWLILIGFIVARNPLGSPKSFQAIILGFIVSMASIYVWYLLVESEFGTVATARHYIASNITMLLSVLIFRGLRRLKQRSRERSAGGDWPS